MLICGAVVCLCLASVGSGDATAQTGPAATLPAQGEKAMTQPMVLWDPAAPMPRRLDMPTLDGVTRVTVHRAIEGEYQFLSGPCIVAHKGRLFAYWTNGPRDEDPDAELCRGRWSDDGGRTWSDVEIVAGNTRHKPSYGHGTLLSHQDKLWVFPACFYRGKDGVLEIRMEGVLRDDKTGTWESRGIAVENFWAHEAPKPLPGGGWLVGGDMGPYPGHGPAIALIDKDSSVKWQVVPIPIPYGKKDYYAGETTVWVDRLGITAVIRNPEKDVALVSTSADGGRTWSEPVESNYPMAESRAYADTLSTGQRYLVSNSGNREFLTIAVTRPGQKLLSKVWMVRKGRVPPRWSTHSKKPQWSYPWVTEHKDNLYVIYAAGKEDCELSIIPLRSLQAE